MFRDFNGDKTTERQRAKELTSTLLQTFAQEWRECIDEETGKALTDGLTEREIDGMTRQLERISEQFNKYHKIS
jgi:hypothetical protein